MGNQKEFFKKIHPNQFSDSKIKKKAILDREFFDFFLDTLTSKRLEKEFEDFCRKIAEAEICPNLLPQTGPTGGGDSKVDSETYPVSKEISLNWYYGSDNKFATERWAFAISAKRDWKAKVKSDVEKISKVNEEKRRGYSKIFFMSNQYIPDKKRAETEDELRKIYNLDVRILDRSWLLDKSLKNNKNIKTIIESFNLSDNFLEEKEVGENDYSRLNELKNIESELENNNLKASRLVELSKKRLILSRELEVTKNQIMQLIYTNERICNENGNINDIADSIYDAAWTLFWWYSDSDLYYEYYKRYEQIVINEKNVNMFKNIVTLWINLNTIFSKKREELPIIHFQNIRSLYDELTTDISKPNTIIEAKASYQVVRIFIGDNIDDIIDDIIEIVKNSFGHIDLDLSTLSRMLYEIPFFENGKRFNELFELMAKTMSENKQKKEMSILLYKRGTALKNKRPYEALSFLSRALIGFYNDDSKNYLINTVQDIAEIFEKIGLIWASRNFYYYNFCLCLNQYLKYGEVYPGLVNSSNSLKYIELKLGHILYAINFKNLSEISNQIYPYEIKYNDDELENFDLILAIQILRTEFEVEKHLGKLPDYLKKQGLFYSYVVMKYELGYYDIDILNELDNDKIQFDEFIENLTLQPVINEFNNLPWYGIEDSCILKTNLLGCSIELNINGNYENGEKEFGATILATLESFFGTGVLNKLFSFNGKVIINLNFKNEQDEFIKGNICKDKPNVIFVSYKNYESNEIIYAQEEFSNFMLKLIGMVTSIMFPYEDELKKIEKMIENDAALVRSQMFCYSIFYGMETVGKNTFSFNNILQDFDETLINRTEKSNITDIKEIKTIESNEKTKKIIYNPPKNLEYNDISNENIITSSIINIPLWNNSNWAGVLYLASIKHEFPPILSLIFLKEISINIFEEWIKDFGNNDVNNRIGIRIIKGINKEKPNSYRIAIGPSDLSDLDNNKSSIYTMSIRMHTMEPDNNKNLNTFENSLKHFKKYSICPAFIKNYQTKPKIYEELMIEKNIDSIVICDACDITEADVLSTSAILPMDNPIIPEGKEDAFILSIIQRRKNLK